MKTYTYQVTKEFTPYDPNDPVRESFEIVIWARSDMEASRKAAMIGMGCHLMLLGPKELENQQVYL